MIEFLDREINRLEGLLKVNTAAVQADEDFISREITRFRCSAVRALMLCGERYYRGDHDILHRQRTVIGSGGELEEVTNIPNNRMVDNQYKKAVIQKCNYLLGQPFVLRCKNEKYSALLKDVFNKDFMRLVKNIYKDALNCGVGYLFVGCDDSGRLRFNRLRPYECIPIYADAERLGLEGLIRFYSVVDYSGSNERERYKAEVYRRDGVHYYDLDGGRLTAQGAQSYITRGGEMLNWDCIPIVAFKYNNDELPLIKRVKTLQDGLNMIISSFQNNMEEDIRSTILVLKNYDGENLGEFRQNLSTYGAVKVRTADGCDGGVEALRIEVNSENYKAVAEMLKKAIIENAMCYDAKDDRMSGTPNQMNIQSMYSDIDLDANETETEFQAAFEKLIKIVNAHLKLSGRGNYFGEECEVIFNRDILINESEAIDNCSKSVGILSNETVVAQHPWVDDVQEELKRLEKDADFEDVKHGGENDVEKKQGILEKTV